MQDAFDATLDKTAAVLVRNDGQTNSYGVGKPEFRQVGTALCRVSIGKGRAKERKDGAKWSKNYRCVFMRPFVDNDGNKMSHYHWLLIDGTYYDVFQVDNPGEADHHLEVWCELLLAKQ